MHPGHDAVDALPDVKPEALVRLVRLNDIRQLARAFTAAAGSRVSVALDEKGIGGGRGRKKQLEAEN